MFYRNLSHAVYIGIRDRRLSGIGGNDRNGKYITL